MITHFIPSCPKVINNRSSIAIYRDSEDPYLFYYINSLPRVRIDKSTKKPSFDFMVIGRGIKKAGSEEVQEGRLVMEVNLALTDEEMNDVERTVTNFVNSSAFSTSLSKYPKYDARTVIRVNPSSLSRNSRTRVFMVRNAKVTIRPVDFTSGKASVNLASSDFQGKFTHETKPNLFGDCNATFAANFDAQESQILYGIFKPEKKTDKSVNLSAAVNYEMKYNTIVQFKAYARVEYHQIYTAFKSMVNSHAGMDSKYYGLYVLPPEMNNMGSCVYSNGADLYISKEDLQNYLRNGNSMTQNITIKLDSQDNDPNNDQYEQLLLEALKGQITQLVCDKMFEKVEPLDPNDIGTPHDVEIGYIDNTTTTTSGDEKEETTEHKKRNVVYDVDYKLRNDVRFESRTDWDFTIEKNKVIETSENPNSSLEILMKDYNVSTLVREYDASEIYFQEMKVPVAVESINFENDIAMISVRVIYKNKSGGEKLNRVFNFDKDNPDSQIFSVLMDRDGEGKLIDKFYYQTRIRYREYDVYGKNMSENDKWSELKECQGIGEGIYVQYVDMRNLCVTCNAGDVAWNFIEKMDVIFKYKDAPDQKGATKIITLTQEHPSDVWNCFMYKGTSNYIYQIHYYYLDGTDDWSKEFEATSESVTVNDKLSGVFRTKFDINFKKSVERIKVTVRCQGREEDSGWIYQPDTWTWETRLKEDKEMSYQYRYQYYLVNGDDAVQGIDWTAPIAMNTDSNQQTITIDLRVNQISLIIDGESLDWSKWSRVYLHFRYDDDANNLHYDDEKIPPLKLSPNKTEDTVIIPVINDSIRPRIFAEYIPVSGDDVIPSDEVTANKIVILPNAAPPKRDTAAPSASSTSTPSTPTGGGASQPQPPQAEPAPVVKDLSLTFSVKSMDWDKWMCVYVHIKYDDDANGIHYSDQNLPPFKMSQGKSEDKTITLQIKSPGIQPIITVDYMMPSTDIISSEATPVTGPMVVLPDAVPPKE